MTNKISEKQRQYASFYTPPELAQILTDWAITDPKSTILDPSFGGCAFLYASMETLKELGNSSPGRQIFGVDIDPEARSYLHPLINNEAGPEQFVISDFFALNPQDLSPNLFDSVVGNPPYIRYHSISDKAEEQAILSLKRHNIKLSRRASYWAFFLLYSMQFLRKGGRLAMVLPGSLFHTDYSEQVRLFLKGFFREVTIFLLEDRVFDGTEEESVIVFANGAREPNESVRIGEIQKIKDLSKALQNGHNSTRQLVNETRDGEWIRALVNEDALKIYDKLAETENFIRLGELVTTRLGVVTGNNSYFILSPDEQAENHIPDEFLTPVVRRPLQLPGLTVNNKDLLTGDRSQKYLLLAIRPDHTKLPKSVKRYIEYGQTLEVDKGTKCGARKSWYSVPEIFVPQAFMPCMSASWPHLTMNRSIYTCTNNILRLTRTKYRPDLDWPSLALGTLSTFSQFSAELVGRSYGGGVLKLEPKELVRLIVPILPRDKVSQVTQKVDSLLKSAKYSEATELVDAEVIKSDIGLRSKDLERIMLARNQLLGRRRHNRNDASRFLSTAQDP